MDLPLQSNYKVFLMIQSVYTFGCVNHEGSEDGHRNKEHRDN